MIRRCPEQHANVFEVLVGQMAENREINAVLGEALGILPQPEFLQPFRDRLHCSSLASILARSCENLSDL